MGMAKTHLEALKMANAQRQRATADMLLKKRRVERTVPFSMPGDDGPEEVDLLFRAIGAGEYDRLVNKYPPTPQQKKDGLSYNLDKFAPALLARVCIEPMLPEEDWFGIWDSEDWNRGETMSLFLQAVDTCTRGLDVNPTESG